MGRRAGTGRGGQGRGEEGRDGGGWGADKEHRSKNCLNRDQRTHPERQVAAGAETGAGQPTGSGWGGTQAPSQWPSLPLPPRLHLPPRVMASLGK